MEQYYFGTSEHNMPKGIKTTEETKKKISDALLGRKKSKEHCLNISKGLTGKKLSYEHKMHCSLGQLKGNNYMRGRFGDKHPNWLGGTSFLPYSFEFSEKLKLEILIRDNYTCQICFKKQEELKGRIKKLCIHHIDYNKNNQSKENLISLCHSCHGKTNAKRSFWKRYFKTKK